MGTVDLHLIIHADRDGPKKVRFWLEEVKASKGDLGYLENGETLNFKNATQENFRIAFELCDKTRWGLRFRKKVEDAFWIQKGDICPGSFAEAPNEFRARVNKGRKRLILIDRNRDQEKYRYAMNFVDTFNNKHPFDPIVENGAGGGGIDNPEFPPDDPFIGGAVLAVGAGFAALATLIGLAKLFGKDRGSPP